MFIFGWTDITIQGWASIIVISSFLGGLSLLLLSIVIEYISIILLHTQGKPTFLCGGPQCGQTASGLFQGPKRC